MSLSQVTNHAEEMKAKLATQFKDSANWEALLNVLGSEIQEAEDALYGILVNRVIATATGATLDGIGDILGMPRATAGTGLSDADYRLVLNAMVLAVSNSGEPETMMGIAQEIITEWTTATFHNDVGGSFDVSNFSQATTEAKARRAAKMLQIAAGAAIRPVVNFAISAEAGLFQFDAGPGFDVGLLAGSISTPSTAS